MKTDGVAQMTIRESARDVAMRLGELLVAAAAKEREAYPGTPSHRRHFDRPSCWVVPKKGSRIGVRYRRNSKAISISVDLAARYATALKSGLLKPHSYMKACDQECCSFDGGGGEGRGQ